MPKAESLLHWTGHPLVDVGIAGLLVFSGLREPNELTLRHLDEASAFMVETYYSGKLLPFLSCVFMNASFVQTKELPKTRAAFQAQYLRAHRAPPHPAVAGRRCTFSGDPAISPMVRTHLPLFSGEGVLNFRPAGQTAVPVAGPYVVALMFLPLAGRRAEGRLLAIHADDPALTLRFARRYLDDNRRLLELAIPTDRAILHDGYTRELLSWDAAKKRYKFADAKGPRSLVVADLADIAGAGFPSDGRRRASSLTAYLLSNSGQGPSLEIFNIPSGVVSFVHLARGARTAAAWQAIAMRFRPINPAPGGDISAISAPASKPRARATATPVRGGPGWSKNPAFEDLCAIFDGGFTDRRLAATWVRRYILARIERKKGIAYEATRARSWDLADLFLQEVMGMNRGEIEAIKSFADRLADWIHRKNDRRLHRALAFERPRELRTQLLRVQRDSAVGGPLLFGMEEYASVWLHPDRDEYLVRDLVCLRTVERLHELNWYIQHPAEAIEAHEAATDEDTKEEAEP